MTMDKFDWFKNEFENLSNDEQVEIFNKFCQENRYEDEIKSHQKSFKWFKPIWTM